MKGPLRLALVWHFHQPDYTDPATGAPSMPWTRLHALKDYADMARSYARYVEDAFAENYFIGYHHCGFIEQWDGSQRGDVATNENGLLDPFEKVDAAIAEMVPAANRKAPL